jgi:5'-deoxynucleotidase YfbR-like HD superfamily hydrolase
LLKELKQKKENLAMEYYVIEAGYANTEFAEQLKEDWREFEENKTYDAQLVHDTDRYDCATRLLWYEKLQGGKWRQDKMFQGEIDRIVTSEVKLWAQKLTEERKAFWASRTSDDLIIFIVGTTPFFNHLLMLSK